MQGNAARNVKDYDKALRLYTEAIELNKDAIYFGNRSLTYGNKLQWDLALKDADEVALSHSSAG